MQLYLGDCLDVLRTLPDNSVDSVVTDPPYGLSFMGRKWDYDVPSVEIWAECLRVLKPGGHLLAFAGTRTQHRMCVRIEDAGFEIRDMIAWVYGSGFPKSYNGEWGGAALKPALEPITMARKSLIGTVAANYAEHGTGGLNIEGCRVGTESTKRTANAGTGDSTQYRTGNEAGIHGSEAGRWPANLIHDGSDEVLAAFPNAPGQLANASTNDALLKTQSVYGKMRRGRAGEPSANSENQGEVGFKMKPGERRLDSGSASRFFYCAKASKRDRNEGCETIAPQTTSDGPAVAADNAYQRGATERANSHPTVKPTDLMRYLCRLVTPPGGIVLDPFAGSGSTGKGALLEGFQFIGIERELEYWLIAHARLSAIDTSVSTG